MNHKSSNYAKHTTKNLLQKWLIKRFHEQIFLLLIKTNPRNILEAGCGEGFSSKSIFSKTYSNFVGIDINIKSILLAKKNFRSGFFLQANILDLPFIESSFDLVINLEVLEHLENPLHALNELYRVSKKWLILSVPNEPYFCIANFMRGKNLRSWGNDPGHINHWSKKSFIHFVEQCCIVKRKVTSFPWTILLCKK